ncbi:HSP20 family molecular chaperone IbpA [Rhodoblastus acidophilus]|uniref:Hsp20/alpha crystallin family protein n=1 Tax=Rhodoblastus acidophilus TaxID=1074 RepID=UPI002224B547|nr:Hsp20/alpha crystallin family protein [Rhodoblastus acidophilus]MCW2319045.1 HSP20 family molecular chaperone IbpA [Rhodoblastus acidophilus]
MSRNDKKDGFDALGEIGVRLGGLFGAVETAIGEIAKAKGEDGKPFKTHVDWGVSVGGVRSGAGAAEAAAERAERKPEAAPRALREPVFEMFEEDDHVLLTYELPGAALDEVALSRDGRLLKLETTGRALFRHQVELPVTIGADAEPARALRNGVLELRFETSKA